MTGYWQLGSWKLAISSSFFLCGAFANFTGGALAQITPDTTLGGENSTVTSTGSVDAINGGATRGANLFHSFQEFNVGEGRAAVFTNPAGIENILTRVTGANPSNIFGTLGLVGDNANLVLINPNGIIFGANARLDVGGSFVGTTANAIGFGNQGFFSATNPESSSSLLSVNPSSLLFNQIRAAKIENSSVAPSGLNPSTQFTATGLRVPNGNSLLLIGGDIKMDGGGLFAFGGRVELGGLAGAGTVELNGDGNNLSLSFPDGVERSDVSLSNRSRVDVIAGNGGSITVNARNLEMTVGSYLVAGIESGLGSSSSKAGNIEVNVTGEISLNNRALISNWVLPEANGQGGDISISASTLQVEGGAQLGTVFDASKGESSNVDTQNAQLIGRNTVGLFPSGSGASSEPNSTGNAGDLTVKTNTLLIRGGGQVGTVTFGAGKGGNVTVDAQDMKLIGRSADSGLFSSSLASFAERNSIGDAGNLTIKTNTLLVQDGAAVSTGTFGAGKGGNLTVDAQDVQLLGFGRRADSGFGSGLYTSTAPRSTGDAGNLTIKTNTLLMRDGAQVNAATYGAGKGGNLTIDAQDIKLIGFGRSADGSSFGSNLSTSAQPNTTGDAGNLTIKTNSLLVRNGASVRASTYGAGKGGSLTVDAQDVQIIGTSTDGSSFSSTLNAAAELNSTGNAGNLTIRTNSLLVQNGAIVSAGTYGAGKGGNLTIDAQDVQIIGRGRNANGSLFRSTLSASAQPNTTGDAGNLTIKTNSLLVRDGAGVSVQSLGTGTAGNMTINASSIRLDNNALLTANTQSAKVDPNREQATININSRGLIMHRSSNIRTNATGENVIGGNINIDTGVLVALENSDINANSANFRGGRVKINASGILGTQLRDALTLESDITATGASPQFSGTVDINTLDLDSNSGLVNLPIVPIDPQIAQTCTPGSSQSKSEFVVTGRGGLPPSPEETLTSDAIQVDWVTLNPYVENRSSPDVSTNPTAPHPVPIVEAQGWVIDNNGEVVLTASAPSATPNKSWQNPANCHATRNSS